MTTNEEHKAALHIGELELAAVVIERLIPNFPSLREAARELTRLRQALLEELYPVECNCVLPGQSCAACRAAAREVYKEE